MVENRLLSLYGNKDNYFEGLFRKRQKKEFVPCFMSHGNSRKSLEDKTETLWKHKPNESVSTALCFSQTSLVLLPNMNGRRKAFFFNRLQLQVIYQIRGRVFHQDIQTPISGLKNETQSSFFNPLSQVFEYPDETLFRVFDKASQTDH